MLNVPVYVYRRWDGSTFETEQRMAEDALVACPTTGQSVERVLQPFTPRYKGTGFYATDHRSANGDRQPPEPAAQRPVSSKTVEGRGMTDRAP